MKKILFSFLLILVFGTASAQIGYQQTYNNHQQQYNTPQSSTQTYRATAYTVDYQGNVYKMPIMVEVIKSPYGGLSMRVSQKYVDTGFGGRWEKIYSGANVQECRSFGNNNTLESQFMFKVSIDTKTWYFDL